MSSNHFSQNSFYSLAYQVFPSHFILVLKLASFVSHLCACHFPVVS